MSFVPNSYVPGENSHVPSGNMGGTITGGVGGAFKTSGGSKASGGASKFVQPQGVGTAPCSVLTHL